MVLDARATSCAQIACNADFHGNLFLGEILQEVCIVGGIEPGAEPFRADIQRAPDGARASTLSRVRSQAQAFARCVSIALPEEFRCASVLVAANSDADDT